MQIFGLFDYPVTIALICVCLALVYIYGKWRNRLLKDHGIPGPEPEIFLGNLRMYRNGPPDIGAQLTKKYGKVMGVYLGGIPLIRVSDTDILRQIFTKEFINFTDRVNLEFNNYPVDNGLFFSTGATWRRLRHILSPTFSGGKLRQMCDRINACAKTLTQNFCKAADSGEIVKQKEYFGAFTMDVIASTAFGIDTDSQNDFENDFVNKAKKVFNSDLLGSPLLTIRMIFPGSAPLLTMLGFSTFPKDSKNFFVKVITEMIQQRKQDAKSGAQKRTDFLQLLIDAEDDGKTDDPTESGQPKSQSKAGKKMSTEDVIGQAFLFFVAGYETTASTLQFAAHCLATNPDTQERLFQEIVSVLREREPDYDNIGELQYLDHVITETLRLYPSVPTLTRQVGKTTTINGFTFPKGAGITVPVLGMHRNPEYYPDPKRFNPDRWEKKADMDPMTYLPFGQGPRICIGMRLALVEIKIALVHVLRKIMFVRLEDTPDVINDFYMAGLLAPKQTLSLRVERRQSLH